MTDRITYDNKLILVLLIIYGKDREDCQMVTIQLRMSQEEFIRIVEALQRRRVIGELRGTIEVLKTEEEKVEEIVEFLQDLMIDVDNEDILGFCNHELIVGGITLLIDVEGWRLKELVKTAMDPWESIKV